MHLCRSSFVFVPMDEFEVDRRPKDKFDSDAPSSAECRLRKDLTLTFLLAGAASPPLAAGAVGRGLGDVLRPSCLVCLVLKLTDEN
jgi:hypothetical protein